VRFDDQLREAFRREEPDPGFAERTLAAIEQRSRKGIAGRSHRTWSGWLAITAAMFLLVLAGNAILKYQQARRARQNVELALRIATDTLNHVQMRLAEVSERRGVPHAP
jgi:hypothetical protein